MVAYLKDRGFDGMFGFMHKQAHEEYEHAMKMYGFLTSVGKLPVFESINKPAANYKSELDVFQQALQHEKTVTSRIDDLVDLAREENDKRAEIFLQWYVTEQAGAAGGAPAVRRQGDGRARPDGPGGRGVGPADGALPAAPGRRREDVPIA